jgi:cyclic dehypoxanthinyl futalosine synthase
VLTDDWLNVNRVWHALGGRSTATMMFGHIETLAERIEHLERLRQLQDETGGFTAFICWTFQPGYEMAHLPAAGSFEYLKTQAVSRLYLDNFANIQSSWVTQGLKIGQLALLYGANDMGSLMIREWCGRRHGPPDADEMRAMRSWAIDGATFWAWWRSPLEPAAA